MLNWPNNQVRHKGRKAKNRRMAMEASSDWPKKYRAISRANQQATRAARIACIPCGGRIGQHGPGCAKHGGDRRIDRIKARTIRFVQHTVDFPVEKLSVVERSALTVKDMPSGNIDLREIRKQRIAIAVNSVYRRKAQRQIHGGHYGNERKSQDRIRRRVKRTSLIFITIGRKRGQAPSPETVLVGKLLSRRWSQSPFSANLFAVKLSGPA